MLHLKPVIDLNISVEGAPAAIFVNGALVIKDRTGQPNKFDHPINHLLRSGDNEVELRLYDYEDAPASESCEARLTLNIRNSGDPGESASTITTLAFSARAGLSGSPVSVSGPEGTFDSQRGFGPYESGDVVVGPVTMGTLPEPYSHITSIKRTVNLALPFQPWAFLTSEPMRQLHELSEVEAEPFYRQLLAAYGEIWDGLAAKDLRRLLPFFKERNRELDVAFWKQPGDSERRLTELLEQAFADPDLELGPIIFPDGYWSVQIGTTGTLAGLTFDDRAEAILRFDNHAGGLWSMNFPMFFRREKGRFIVAR